MGTSYNFTDTYFFGYNSSVTCGVWVGFDRPTQIYRGAFGKDLALPIWATIMNVAADELPALKLPRPDTLKAVEICRRSGLLATPRCAREGDPEGKEHGTFTEYGTAAQLPKIRCDIHGGGVRNYAREYDKEQWPRAAAAIDLSMIRPVAVVAPTLLGLGDVYASVRPAAERFDDTIPVARAIPVNAVDGQDADGAAAETSGKDQAAQAAVAAPAGEPEVRKAEAVRPLDSPLDMPSIQAPTPEPITFYHRARQPHVRSNAPERGLAKMNCVLDVCRATASDGWNRTAGKHWRQVEVNLVHERTVEGLPENTRSPLYKNACNSAPSQFAQHGTQADIAQDDCSIPVLVGEDLRGFRQAAGLRPDHSQRLKRDSNAAHGQMRIVRAYGFAADEHRLNARPKFHRVPA